MVGFPPLKLGCAENPPIPPCPLRNPHVTMSRGEPSGPLPQSPNRLRGRGATCRGDLAPAASSTYRLALNFTQRVVEGADPCKNGGINVYFAVTAFASSVGRADTEISEASSLARKAGAFIFPHPIRFITVFIRQYAENTINPTFKYTVFIISPF